MANVGKIQIHGAYGLATFCLFVSKTKKPGKTMVLDAQERR